MNEREAIEAELITRELARRRGGSQDVRQEPQSNPVMDFAKWATKGLVSPETLQKVPITPALVPIMQMASGQAFMSPNNLTSGRIPNFQRQGAEELSSQTSPLALTGDVAMGLGFGAKAMGGMKGLQRLGSTTKEAFINPAKASEAFTGWRNSLSENFAASKAGIKSGLSQRVSEIGKEGEFAAGIRKDELQQSINSINKKTAQQVGIVESGVQKKLASIGETEMSLKGKLGRVSTQEAKQLQKDTLALIQKRSSAYGDELSSVMAEAKDVPARGVKDALENALVEHNVLVIDETGNLARTGGNISAEESKWLSMYNGLKENLSSNPEAKIAAQDLLKTEQQARVPFGKAWTKDNHLVASIKESMSDTLKDSVTGLRELRTKYAPYLNLKKEAIKKLNIFGDTSKASASIRRVATSMGKTGAEERRLMGLLERELGSDIGSKTKTIQKGFNTLGEQKLAIKTQAQKTLAQIKSDVGETVYNMRKTARGDIDAIKAKYDLLKQSHGDNADYIIDKMSASKDASIERLKTRIDKLQAKYKSARFRTKVGVGVAVSMTPIGKYMLRKIIEYSLHN